MKIITAPEPYIFTEGDVTVFLAGGIQNTEDWQHTVLMSLSQIFKDDPLVILNPRRPDYNCKDPAEQIKWEHDMLARSNIFSMYFAGGDSCQPICMFEYGVHLERRHRRGDLDRLVVSVHPSYCRYQDVLIQTSLVDASIMVNMGLGGHIYKLIETIKKEIARKALLLM